MSTDSRESPARIWAGHLGGGRRIWKPELTDESEKAFATEYVRADVAADMLQALHLVGMSAGWQYLTFETRDVIEAAIAKAEGK